MRYLFSEFTLDTDRRELRRGAELVAVAPQVFDLLEYLIRNRERVVTKDDIVDAIWNGRAISDAAVTTRLNATRRAVDDSGEKQQLIRTLPRKGFRFVGPVKEVREGRDPPGADASIMGDRLRAEASRRFVGRDAELRELRSAISPTPSRTSLYFVHGPGGIGKTSLLERLRVEAAAGGIGFVTIDGAGIPPEPDAIMTAVTNALVPDGTARSLETLSGKLGSDRNVLAIDSFEHLEPASGWVRDTLLPSLPSRMSMVLAGREPPDSRWTAHPLWGTAMHCIGLDSLSRAESARLLAAYDVAEHAHVAIVELCHGHPLALVMLAAEVRRLDHVPQGLGADLVRELTRRCIAQAPTPLHRAALDACAQALSTTVALLSDVVDPASATMLFEWLAEQNYVRAGPHGLHPHELVRVVLDEQLRWQDAKAARALQQAIKRHLIRLLHEGQNRSRTALELQFLGRHSPLMQRFFDYSILGSVPVSPATEADAAAIARLRDAALPPAERLLFDHWRGHHATRALVARHGDGKVCGVTLILPLDQLDDRSVSVDPVVSAVWRALGDAFREPAAARVSLMSRFNVPEGERRGLNPAMNALQMYHATLWVTEPNLRFYVLVAIHPDHFAPLLEGTGFQRMSGCDHVVDGLPIGCFVHDWEAEPWLDWHDRYGWTPA